MSPLGIVLGGGAPHQGVLEVCNERLVDLPAQRIYGGPPSVRRHDHRIRKVWLPSHLIHAYEFVFKPWPRKQHCQIQATHPRQGAEIVQARTMGKAKNFFSILLCLKACSLGQGLCI